MEVSYVYIKCMFCFIKFLCKKFNKCFCLNWFFDSFFPSSVPFSGEENIYWKDLLMFHVIRGYRTVGAASCWRTTCLFSVKVRRPQKAAGQVGANQLWFPARRSVLMCSRLRKQAAQKPWEMENKWRPERSWSLWSFVKQWPTFSRQPEEVQVPTTATLWTIVVLHLLWSTNVWAFSDCIEFWFLI